MALRDEIKAARRDLVKNGTTKEKISYFFEYYTLHLVLTVVAIVFIIVLLYSTLTKPNVVLNGIILNSFNFGNEDAVESLEDDFLDHLQLDAKRNEVALNSSLTYKVNASGSNKDSYDDYETSQVLMVQCAAGSVDFISAQVNSVLELAYGEMFQNLEDVLTEEELQRYEPYLLYVDKKVVEEKNAAIDRDENPDLLPSPDPAKPEEMEEPIPVFIDVSSCEKIASIYNYTSDTLVLGIAVNAPNPEQISAFLEYVFE